MTHKELLADIDRKILLSEHTIYPIYMQAFRAVVELHRPMSDREPFCNECRGVHQGEVDVVIYPCPTIQAIEKELHDRLS